jgi:hypothetical protein
LVQKRLRNKKILSTNVRNVCKDFSVVWNRHVPGLNEKVSQKRTTMAMNIFRLTGDMLHTLGIGFLLWQLIVQKNAEGQ